MREAIEEAFWNFVDQKWRDALNVAAAEPLAWGTGSSGRAAPQDGGKRGGAAEATKLAKAAVHVTGIDGKRHRQGDSGRTCVFQGVMGCPGTHTPWHCKVFGKLPAREREKLIKDNRLCPFCLLHDASKSWLEQDEEVTVGVYQVGTCQSADGVPTETGEEAAKHPSTSQRGEAEIMENGWQAPGLDDLLIEGEDGEYFLKLLMRKASPERPKADRLVGGRVDPRDKLAPVKGKEKKKKKVLKGNKVAVRNGTQKEESTASLTSKQEKQAAPNLLSNPEAKGRGVINDGRPETESMPRSKTTSRGECSGQKMPDS
jgi:hypothetical protein